jgi:tryptophan 2,3-dioxygenase
LTASGDPTYWDYLKLDKLLNLQNGFSPDESVLSEDELHFIIVHQVIELWFKVILRELRLARDKLSADWIKEEEVQFVVHHLRRVNEVFSVAVDYFRVLETLTPQDFLAFRKQLGSATGAQSYQLREIEILLGITQADRPVDPNVTAPFDPIKYLVSAAEKSPGGENIVERLDRAEREVNIYDALRKWLQRTPINGSYPNDENDDEVVNVFINSYLQSIKAYDPGLSADFLEFAFALDTSEQARQRTKRIRAGLLFIESYRELPLLAWPRQLIDSLVEAEELLILWRNRHARMVERVIGCRVGTGGSAGTRYLDETTRIRVFRELWTVRTLLLPRDAAPPIINAEFYQYS